MRADEAGEAADRATEAAERAVDNIKPAYEAAAQAVRSANDASTAAVNAHNAAANAASEANRANQAATRATQYENSAWGDASIADSAAQSATNAAAMAGKAAAEADRLHNWAKASTSAIHTFATGLTDALKTLTDEKAKQDEIARKKSQFEENFKSGLLTFLKCNQMPRDAVACKKVGDFIADKGKQAIDAGLAHLDHVARCFAGDQAACRAADADDEKVLEFMKQVGIGLLEGAKNFVAGFKMLVDCGSWATVGVVGESMHNCLKTIEQFMAMPKMLKEHPFELIHLSVWETNPGKALGLTLFDVGTFFLPGIGATAGALAKIVSGLQKLIGATMARLANGVGTIQRFSVRLAGDAARIAKLGNVTVKIDGGVAKILDGNAVIDGAVYKLEGVGLKLSGAAEDFLGGTIRIDGGVIRLEGKVAKLEDATVKVEKPQGPDAPEICGVPGLARTAALPPCGDQPDGSWVGEENGQPLALSKEFNDEAKRALKLAHENEPKISETMIEIGKKVREARFEKWDAREKTANSLKRKVAGKIKLAKDPVPEKIVGSITDNVRYTMTFEFDSYVEGVHAAMTAMRAEESGFELVDFNNYWKDPTRDYKGINSTWKHRETGQYFELQFHTKDSYQTGDKEHEYYEAWRVLPPGPERDAIKQYSKELWGDGNVPPPPAAFSHWNTLGRQTTQDLGEERHANPLPVLRHPVQGRLPGRPHWHRQSLDRAKR